MGLVDVWQNYMRPIIATTLIGASHMQAPDSAVTSPEQRLPPLEHRLPAIPSLDAQFRQQSWPSTNFSPAGMANLFRQLAQHGVQPEAAASPGVSRNASATVPLGLHYPAFMAHRSRNASATAPLGLHYPGFMAHRSRRSSWWPL